MKKFLIILAIIIVSGLVLAGIGFGVYYYYENYQPEVLEETESPDEVDIVLEDTEQNTFSDWDAPKVDYTAQVDAYTVKDDLSDLADTDLVSYWTDDAKKHLATNKFAVTPAYHDEFFSAYEQNRYSYVPNFITSDSVLHTYHLYFNYLLENLENQYLIAEAKTLTQNMYDESVDQYNALKGTEWEDAAKHNIAFFNVALKILTPDAEINSLVKEDVEAELALIDAHDTLVETPLWNNDLKEDYTQYIARGHYTKSDELKKYFKTMMWYGRLSFRFKEAKETKSAVLMTTALNDSEIFTSWDKIYEPTNFFVGKSDDISYYELIEVVKEVYGDSYALTDLNDSTKFSSLHDKAKKLEGPSINSIPVIAPDAGGNEDLEEEIKAYRFMGQRYTIDADVFQNLIYRRVEINSDDQKRMLPKALDIPAAMGSEEAYDILEGWDQTDYENYPENMEEMQKYIAGLSEDEWTQNLYWGWMNTLKPLTEVKGEGYPSFMTNNSWTRKQLMTYLSSWTELKHDTILYAKQVYAELGAGMIEEKDDRGYVEPQPELYSSMAGLIKLTREGLHDRQLITSDDEENLTTLHTLVTNLLTISEKELENETLTDEEYDLIKSYGGSLEHFWLETFSEEERGEKTSRDLLVDSPAPLVADVATDPNGQVLEEATGKINDIYVIVPVDGTLKIARGGVYSHYEFIVGLSERMTDEQWREKLTSDDVPEVADWHSSFLLENYYE